MPTGVPATPLPLLRTPMTPKPGCLQHSGLLKPFWESGTSCTKLRRPASDDERLMAGAMAGLKGRLPPAPQRLPASGDLMPTPTPELIVPRVCRANIFDPFWAPGMKSTARARASTTQRSCAAPSRMLAATGDKHTSYMDPDTFAQANSKWKVSTRALAPGWTSPANMFRSFPQCAAPRRSRCGPRYRHRC